MSVLSQAIGERTENEYSPPDNSLLAKAIAEREAVAPVTFSVDADTIEEMRILYMPLRCAGINDTAGLATVSSARKACIKARNSIEATRKELKAVILEQGRHIDGKAKSLTSLLQPIEKHLADQEDAVKNEMARIENAKLEEVIKGRMDRLRSVGANIPESVVRLLNGVQFADEFQRASTAAKQQEELRRLREAEENRIAAERETQRQERERLSKLQADIDAETRRLNAVQAEQRRAQEAIDKVARDAELVRVAEQTRIETEERILRQAAKKTEEAAQRAAAASDVEKVRALGAALRAIAVPDVKSEAATALLTQVNEGIAWAARMCEGFGQ